MRLLINTEYKTCMLQSFVLMIKCSGVFFEEICSTYWYHVNRNGKFIKRSTITAAIKTECKSSPRSGMKQVTQPGLILLHYLSTKNLSVFSQVSIYFL